MSCHTKYCTQYTVLEDVIVEDFLSNPDQWYDLPAGWYVAEGDVTITPRVDTHGEVNLILKDHSHLTAEWGVNVKEGDAFTVYAQSADEAAMGKLTACLPDPTAYADQKELSWGLTGIGASPRYWGPSRFIAENEGTIIINGGNICAGGSWYAPAIGGPYYDDLIHTGGPAEYERQGGAILINVCKSGNAEKAGDYGQHRGDRRRHRRTRNAIRNLFFRR